MICTRSSSRRNIYPPITSKFSSIRSYEVSSSPPLSSLPTNQTDSITRFANGWSVIIDLLLATWLWLVYSSFYLYRYRLEVSAFSEDPSPRHQTREPIGQQQLLAQSASNLPELQPSQLPWCVDWCLWRFLFVNAIDMWFRIGARGGGRR